MSNDPDSKWLEALAGRADAEDSADSREGDALRRAILDEESQARSSPSDLDGLLNRLEDEGLLDESNAPARRPRWLALAASVAMVALVIPLAYMVTDQGPGSGVGPIDRGFVEPQLIEIPAPEQASAALAEALVSLDIEVERYEYEGAWIVDATIAEDARRRAESVLAGVGAVIPEDGRIVLEFREQP